MSRARPVLVQVAGLATGREPVALGLIRALERQGLDLQVADVVHPDPAALDAEVATLGCRGLIAYPHPALGDLRRFVRRGLPVATVLGLRPGVPGAATDPGLIGDAAARHFLALGLRRVAWAGAAEPSADFQRRRAAFLAAALAAGLETTLINDVQGDAATRRSLTALPLGTGILVENDHLGRHLVHDLQRLGRAVPEEVQVLGIDDDQVGCHGCRPHLSSVPQDWGRICAAAVGLLRQRSSVSQQVLVPPGPVVQRGSTGRVALMDALVEAARERTRHEPGVAIATVCRELGVSRDVLERRFRAVLGRSPRQEQVLVRLELARTLLARGMSVAEVSERAGFGHPRSMRRAFVARHGHPPVHWRGAAPEEDAS